VRFLIALLFALAFAAPTRAQNAQTILHLLDYIGVDYPEAVENGKVKSEDEYKEMLEFTGKVSEQLKSLPENAAKASLLAAAHSLDSQVRDKAAPPAVADASSTLRWAIVRAYNLKLAPRSAPDLATGAKLYTQNCASCHGAEGRGDGPVAKGLEPAPSNFHDLERMAQRSAYGLYNTITLGVEGTSMASFKQLSEQERWALAFYVATIGVPKERIAEGERRWKAGEAKNSFPNLDNVATLSTNEIGLRFGDVAARVQDYVRAHPEILKKSSIAFAREKLAEAGRAYADKNFPAARQAAIAGYLEGFELVEASLANVDTSLMREIEREMLELRAAIDRGEPAETFAKRAARVDGLLAAAEDRLGGGELSSSAVFASSLLILLREGLEAILVLAAIIAFVAKTGRRDALPWIHAGWIAALALGALTWVLASFVIDISGADRELTEGITALVAAAVLLYVGHWLHSKSYAEAWTRFIREHVGRALEKRTLWAMALVSFFAVYREMFEIALFYQALWTQAGAGGRTAVLGGMAVAAVLLAAIGFAIFKYSIRLPIGLFFTATSALIALLAIVFTGHGIAALQEAGLIGAERLNFDPVPLLGLYPTVQSLTAQAGALAIVAFGYWAARRGTRMQTA